LSLAEVIMKTFRPMPDSDKATVERYIERAIEELNTAYEELRDSEQLRAVMDAVQRLRKVVAEFQEAISKVQPYATSDPDAAKLAVKLGMIAYALQLVQQRLAEIQATINGAMQPTTVTPQAPVTPTVAPAPTPQTLLTGGTGVI
jgi:tetratricopeptide (TPR) repeat protein